MFLIEDKNWRTLAIVVIASALAFIGLSSAAIAGELAGSRPAMAFAGGSVDTLIYASDASSDAILQKDYLEQMPDAFLIYSGDGNSFYLQRIIDSALETVPVKIPSSSSLMIPAPQPVLVEYDGGVGSVKRWEQQLYINASSVADSVYVIPFFR